MRLNLLPILLILILFQACNSFKEGNAEIIQTEWTNYENPLRSDFTASLEIKNYEF